MSDGAAQIILTTAAAIMTGGQSLWIQAAAMATAQVAGAYIDAKLAGSPDRPGVQEGQRLSDVRLMGSSYGMPIQDLVGITRIAGNVLWAAPIEEVRTVREVHLDGPDNDFLVADYTYFGSFAVSLGRGPILGVRRIWADNKLIHDGNTLIISSGTSKSADGMTVYKGVEEQPQDATIASHIGLENTPAYRDHAYIVFSRLPLADFGNRIPSLSFEVVTNGMVEGAVITPAPVPLADVVVLLASRAGLTTGQVDTSDLAKDVRGMMIGSGRYAEALAPALSALNVDAFQSGRVVRFRELDAADTVDVAADDLGFDGSSSLIITRRAEMDLPRKVSLTYWDAGRDHLQGVQSAVRLAARGRSELDVTVPLVMTAAEAAHSVQTQLDGAWLRRQIFQVKLPPKFLALEPGDNLRITVPIGVLNMRVSKVTIGANLAVEVEGESWDAAVLVNDAQGDTGLIPDNTLQVANTANLRILDIAAPTGQWAAVPYVWVAASGPPPWQQASLYRQIASGGAWSQVAQIPGYAIQGETVSTLPVGPTTIWDTESAVDVDIYRGTLQGRPESEVLAGHNLILIGDELLGFAEAELIATGRYRLSRLLRGRRGTEWAMAGHGVAERAVLIGTARPLALTLAMIGQSQAYRAPVPLQALDDAFQVDFTVQGLALKPWSPVYVRGSRNGGGDLSITWLRRSRVGQELPPAGGDIALGEASERYMVEVMNGSAVVRTVQVSSPAWTYTAAQQVTDFGSAQSAVEVNIFQLSEVVGRGYPATATV